MTNGDQTHSDAREERPALRPSAILAILFATSAACLVIAVVMLVTLRERADSSAASEALVQPAELQGLEVPPFSLTAQDGRTVTRDDLLGRVTVVDFVFTNCPAICPALGQSMRRIQNEAGDTGVRLLSISVDPEHDTPEVLRDYAERIGADPAVWTFATGGSFEQIHAISEQGLRLGLSRDETDPVTLPDGSTMANINHTGKLVLVGPDASVIGLYSGLSHDEVGDLIARLRSAGTLPAR